MNKYHLLITEHHVCAIFKDDNWSSAEKEEDVPPVIFVSPHKFAKQPDGNAKKYYAQGKGYACVFPNFTKAKMLYGAIFQSENINQHD